MHHDEDRTPQHESSPLYSDVIVPRHIPKAFTYLVPAALTSTIKIGHRVLIPFGRTTLEGAVVALHHHLPAGVKAAHLKEIHSLAENKSDIPQALFELSRKIAEEYVAPWGQCLRLILPPVLAPATPPLRYIATDQGRAALNTETCPQPLRPLLARIARRSTGALASTLRTSHDRKNREGLEFLEANKWITTTPTEQKSRGTGPHTRNARSTSNHFDGSVWSSQTTRTVDLPEPDPAWLHRVTEIIQANETKKLLVHAPWEHRASLLARATQQAQRLNRSVLIILGEVARAEWLGHIIATVTALPVSLLHSGLPDSTWADRWEQIQDSVPKIVVGTRSAIFAPLQSIGLIWIDGEENPALKEPQEPRYHARDVAWMRAQTERAMLVLGSSHPSLESRTAAETEMLGTHDHVSNRPTIELVDLRCEPGSTPFSARLLTAMREAVERKDRVLLFLNRKGYAGALVCRDCGWVPRCLSCAVAFTYYRGAARMTCRYCGAAAALPDACPTCGAARLSPVGEGTERVEAEVLRLFPGARVARLDSDTLHGSAAARALWERAASSGWDILIGTQALFQREPLQPVGLVGIVQADSGLHIPDFRAAERTYHLLGDAVSLAQPAAAGGCVILQTLLPAHHAIQSILSGDPSRFYDEELAARQLLGYPPAVHLISLSVSGKDVLVVERATRRLVQRLEETAALHNPVSAQSTRAVSGHPSVSVLAQKHIMILGPVPAVGGRPHGHHRRQILVKGIDRNLVRQTVRASVETLEHEYGKGRVKCVVDVDPIEMG